MEKYFRIKKNLKYLKSIKFLNEKKNFVPEWTSRNDYFVFKNKIDAEIIVYELNDDEVKLEKINISKNFKGNNKNIEFTFNELIQDNLK